RSSCSFVAMHSGKRVLLLDPSDSRRDVLARRLRAQGYVVDDKGDATAGADMALSAPPDAVVADLWMPGISGVQLCRLLRSEPATADVPVILAGDDDEPRNRFWAERAGAAAYVLKGRTGDLVRALAKAADRPERDDGFFVQLSGGSLDIRDRLARHLDSALFESVMAAEIRALASAGSFDRLFDLLAQFLSQVTRYRWIALSTPTPERVSIHHHPALRESAEEEAREALGYRASSALTRVEDEDAAAIDREADPIVCAVPFGGVQVARFALSPCAYREQDAASLAPIIARELGAAVRMAILVEDSQRLAATDMLTGLMNRRAFASFMESELGRCQRHEYPLCFALLDVDHFKLINDTHGHAAGDAVLASIGELLRELLRRSDMAARWGGEEFVVAYTSTDLAGAGVAAERLREALQARVVLDDAGQPIPFTASLGIASWRPGEPLESLVDRADRAMYASKTGGRNRVTLASEDRDLAIVA
ncbi:MAG: diguanylate cyclase, partial [Myxococcota bacterium]|nr:diguanylate cyclase [Myxococcota bacterium]